ncbi:MAG TPA: phosphatidate cytidylyltransferase [Thermoguttaceae bacterium]|nr:phosphatidate cytidylyltransferase [Thermoguttaceae bacterium]
MLRWRLLLGTLIIGILVGLCWLDHLAETRHAAMRGMWLLPVAILFAVAASGEVLYLARAAGMRPLAWAVYGGNVLLIASNWGGELFRAGTDNASSLPAVAWPWCVLAVGVLSIFVGEMRRYEKPGGATANVAAAVFALVYVGVMFSFVVQLRMLWGVGALASLVIVTKMGDTGAYTIGRLFGRHKMAPVLSPGKTIEGAVGALVFACLASWATFTWLLPVFGEPGRQGGTCCGWIPFGLLVGTAGMLGDLAESLLKRDVGCKDSSRWMPGFGGVLDLLDSILLAAPVAWICWALGMVG